MSSQFQNEVWQVVVQGEVYEADTYTLKQWIAEGRILATDRVKKGNLGWNEAQRVPTLRPVFMGEENPQAQEQPPAPPPPAATQAPPPKKESYNMGGKQDSYGMGNVATFQPVYNPGMSMPSVGAAVCYYHPHLAPEYICRV